VTSTRRGIAGLAPRLVRTFDPAAGNRLCLVSQPPNILEKYSRLKPDEDVPDEDVPDEDVPAWRS
jgi:hypothetical protein